MARRTSWLASVGRRALFAAAAMLLLALCLSSAGADASELDLSESGFVPLDLGGMGSLSSETVLMNSPAERELFEMAATTSGSGPPPTEPEPLVIGLNLVASIPCSIYLCRPTPLPGIHVVLNPDSEEALKQLGNVDLKLTTEFGAVSFTTTEGVTFTGSTVNAIETRMVGSLASVNGVLSTLMFAPYANFYGYALLHWQLKNHGSTAVPVTNGTITIVVGSYTLAPSLIPLADDGVLADFDMNENSVSPVFPGVSINDPAQTSETYYKFSIQGFEGHLNLASETEIDFLEGSVPEKLIFECLPDACNAALREFTFTTTAFGPFQGNAGFIIVVTNTFHKTTGFVQGVIRNHATHREPVPGALAPCRISAITATTAHVSWDALPDGFVESSATPAPTGYLMQYATSPAGPWATGYSGAKTENTMSGLQVATTYYCQVMAVNEGGHSPPSPVVDFTTLPGLPGAPTAVTASGATASAISLSWTAPGNTGGGVITMYRIVAQPTSLVGTAMGRTTTISFGTSVTVSGLQGSTAYTFSVFANNAAGAGPAGYTTGATLGSAPVIVSYTASGPSDGANVYGNKVKLAIGFNRATNKPAASNTAEINALFAFSPSIGAEYTGAWSADAKVLTISIVDAGSASPQIGVAYVTAKGAILAAGGNSASQMSVSPALSGSFGSTGSMGGAVLHTTLPPRTESDQDTPTPLSVAINISPLFADGSYLLVASVLSPKLPGSFFSGTGFPDQKGLVVTASGSPAQVQSALSTLMYTPAPGYAGPASFKFELFNKVNNELLSSLVTALNIRAKTALPTVTAPDSIDVILEQFTAVQGVQVGYTDASQASSATFAITISTSHTGAAVFSAPSAGVTFTPAQGTEAGSHQLTGALPALNAALSKLQVKFTFSSNSAQNNYAPDPYNVIVEVASMLAGSDGSRANATRTVNANINCNTAAVPPTAVTSARLENNLNSITVNLELPVSDAYLDTPVFDCDALLDGNSVGLLGATPVCHWVSTVSFRIDLGMHATFVPSTHKLTIAGGKLQRCPGGQNSSPAQTFSVALPLVNKAPKVFVSGPKVTSLCNPLVLQGISSMVGGRAPTYVWQLPRNLNPSHLPADLSKPILEVSPEAFNDGGNFTFSLSVRNYLGVSSIVVSKTITATNLPVPLIFPTGVTELTSKCTAPIRLYNSITVNPCFDEPLRPMVFKWTVTPRLQGDTANIVMDTANLLLPRNVLLPGVQYKATLRVAIATNQALATEIDYIINVATNELKPYIAGGAWRKVRVDAPEWKLDASSSSDPDAIAVGLMAPENESLKAQYAVDQYTYTWQCTTQSGDKCYSSLTGLPLVLVENNVLTMPQGALRVGLYQFTLIYTHLPSKRSASSSALIQVREGVDPTTYGPLGTVDILLDTAERSIAPQSRVHLIASLPTYYTDSTDDLVYTWSVSGGGSSGITTATLATHPAVQGYGTANLLLNGQELEDFFVPGTYYHFKVTVAHKDDPNSVADAGQALISLQVNALPQCDSFVAVASGEGVAFNSSVTVNAMDCYDSDTEELLSYTFFRLDEQGNRFNLLPKSNSPLGRVPLLPTGGDKSLLTIGVVVSDVKGGRVEYTKEIKIQPNPLIRAPAGKPAIDGVAAVKGLYDTTWNANAAISRDTQTLLVIQAAILTELNELVAIKGTLSPAELAALLAYKKTLLADIGKDAKAQPSIQVMQAMVELLEDAKNIDQALLAATIDFVAGRAPSEGGAGNDQELLSTYARVVKQGLDYIVTATGAVSTGANRRLFSHSMESLELGVAEGTPTTANPSAILASALATLNVLAQDISSHSLVAPHATIPVTISHSQGFSGAVGRGAVGQSTNVSTLDGYGVLVSPTAFSNLAPGSQFDLGVWGLSPAPFIGLISPSDATSIVSGGANVAAYLPEHLKTSTAVSTFASGDVEAVIPFHMDLNDCIQGDYKQPTTNDAAPGNVYGNMCKLGCKLWNGQTLSDAGATMVALHPQSKHIVCGLSAPGVAVAFNTRLSEPFVPPTDPDQIGLDGPSAQPNGLPFGVVRASLLLQPAPTIYDLGAFKAKFVEDMGLLTGIPVSRLVVRATSTSGEATTVIWDFLPANDASPKESQKIYDDLIELKQESFNDKPVLKDTVLSSISQLCDDNTYRHECSSGSAASWELPVIISVCCLFFLCCVGCIVFACMRMRRSRAAGGDSLKMAPPMMGTDLVPAKKFVYTAPSSDSNAAEDKVSEVTIMAKGMEFEPSLGAGSHNSAGEAAAAEGSKNRLSAKFPNKSPPAGAAAAAAGLGAAAAAGAAAKEESKSSHHFYYVDESVKGAPTPSNGSSGSGGRRPSRNDSGIAFSLNDGARNELSGSAASRSGSGNSQSQPGTPASDQRRRRGSAPGAAVPDDAAAAVDKAALPVVRPGGK